MNGNSIRKLLNPGYLTLFLVNMVASVSFSMVSTIMTMYLTESAGMTASLAGTLVGILSIAAMIVRPFSGYISDHIRRKHLLMISLGGILIAILGYAFTGSPAVLFLLRILHGISFSLVTTVTMAMVADTLSSDNRSQGMGLFAIGQTITLSVAPGLGLYLSSHLSFRAAFLVAAGFVALAILIAFLFCRDPHTRPVSPRGIPRVQELFTVKVIWFALIAASVSATTAVENSFVALYGKHLEDASIGWYFTVSAVALFVSRMLFGRIADTRGFQVVLYPGLICMAASFILMSLASEKSVVVIFAISAAMKALGLGAVQPVLQAACLNAVPSSQRGVASGTYYFGTDIGQGLAPLAGGAIAQFAGYSSVFLVFAFPLLITGGLYAATHRKPVLKQESSDSESLPTKGI